MASVKSQAIVLRLVEFSETSLIVTLFTEDFGKIGALAKGARRPKGPFEGALDLLALIRIVFLHKSSEALDLLTEAKLERRFRAGEHDLTRLYAGYYVAELLAELTEPGDPHPQLFAAADATLAALDSSAAVAETILKFELVALREAGHLPSLAECVVCGRDVPLDRRVAFGMTAGGVLCDECRSGRRSVVSVSSAAIAALRQFVQENVAATGDREQEGSSVASAVAGELRAVMNNYLAHLVGHRLKMSDLIAGSKAKAHAAK